MVRVLYEDIPAEPKLGVSHDEIAAVLTKWVYNFKTRYASRLKELLDVLQNHPVLVNYTIGKNGHYSVVMGSSPRSIYIRDVWDGHIKKYGRAEFFRMWYSERYGKHWMLWLEGNP